ncbi:Glyoxalase/Bleomycin resistance protein/Dihydroxybiphenyl dioxygenase [Lipomyces tetrasporus]|uniref:Glyoxalase/Bleomycin resistance protein/Dihydroxybiphenyl dioxygenase n=1 Tax=Lipomyces tetrasporus TaxID=54092 RepID=A0AAD7QNP1_9ASCO|nr:Glyoxalase/Bleomycin resistance protein/Dihydroxybiphenyl dioxygenase [Lipomyces tetrasporus]KAJ8098489.1 Glyoxalase/Bleomycin resistance protein/Dihydroxybiphenyl dioxygenase [Lipomyces tetrasporus]
MPFHHFAIRVYDVAKSREFYDPVLSAVGYVVYWASDSTVYYAPQSNPKAFEFGLMLANESKPAGSTHIAFAAASQEEAAQAYRVAIEHGGKDNGAPGIREKINRGYYSSFVLDPDGNNIEFVHFVRQ